MAARRLEALERALTAKPEEKRRPKGGSEGRRVAPRFQCEGCSSTFDALKDLRFAHQFWGLEGMCKRGWGGLR